MSTAYTHFSKLAFDQLFGFDHEGNETLIFNSSGQFVGTIGSYTFPILGAAGTVSAPTYANATGKTGIYFSGEQIFFSQNQSDVGNISNGGIFTIGASGGVSSHTVNGALAPTKGIIGTTTNDSAATGTVGEYLETVQTTNTSYSGSATFEDVGNITLTAGDWEISVLGFFVANSATTTQAVFGIGTASGSASTGIVFGTNTGSMTTQTGATALGNGSVTIPPYRVSITATTTYYFKTQATFSAGTPQYKGRMSARRMR